MASPLVPSGHVAARHSRLPELAETSKPRRWPRCARKARQLNLQLNASSHRSGSQRPCEAKIKENFVKQKPLNDKVKAMADKVQFYQEMGGLVGRICSPCS
jgi:hypothetical protein